jgi:hypothetical protein
MPKKVVFAFSLLAITACFLSYRLGSSPIAYAKARPIPQEGAVAKPPLSSPPATWTLTALGTGTAGAIVTRPAASGVQHVATCITASFFVSPSSTSAIGNTLGLYNGASISGGPIRYWEVYALPGTSVHIDLCGLSTVGTTDDGMTLAWTGGGANEETAVSLEGYDAD